MRDFNFPIVAIGASVGGLETFKLLLESLPDDTGMAFVLLQHLDPNHKSSLSEILQKFTKMQVFELKKNEELVPNSVYVATPNIDLKLKNNYIIVSPIASTNSPHNIIDSFFTSVAKEYGSRSIGVILSGMGKDGVQGIREIKSQGGVTFAQDPKSSICDSMPLNAIQTGCVDFVLEPRYIADTLSHYFDWKYLNAGVESKFPSSDLGKHDILEIFEILKKNFNVDFSKYKQSTINRRLFRRMISLKIYKVSKYLELLKTNKNELNCLYDDLLINVTSFFRNTEAFDALRKYVYPSFLNTQEGQTIRFWVPGCSTGEEVYSLAISFLEFNRDNSINLKLIIFASDVSMKALQVARAGRYPDSLCDEISPDLLSRYFHKYDSGYQINKNIREMCVFTNQNVAADPPFSKIDLISCRNLLIYFDKELQKKVISLFHYGLKPEGFLFLGSSEIADEFNDYFNELSRRHRLYSKRTVESRPYYFFPPKYFADNTNDSDDNAIDKRQADYGIKQDIGRNFIQNTVGVVINEKYDVIHSMGDLSPYITLNQGVPSFNILKMAKSFLPLEIRMLIQKARETSSLVQSDLQSLEVGDVKKIFFLEASLLRRCGNGFKQYLILFKDISNIRKNYLGLESEDSTPASLEASGNDCVKQNRKLQKELQAKNEMLSSLRENLQLSIEVQESNNEKLVIANEEILSSNEELQSTNEELETAKEELQSVNEELLSINQECKVRNEELKIVNSDLINLVRSVELPVVMLDKQMRIRRVTPAATLFFNLFPADVGKSILDFTFKDFVPNLKEILNEVIESVNPKKVEVFFKDTQWVELHVHPYQIQEGQVDGIVLYIMDIHALKSSQYFFESIVETIRDPLIILNNNLELLVANKSFCDCFQISNESKNKSIFDIANKKWDVPVVRDLFHKLQTGDSSINDFVFNFLIDGNEKKTFFLNARYINQGIGQKEDKILLSIQDITVLKDKEEKLKQISEELIDKNIRLEQFSFVASHDLQEPLRTISLYIDLLKTSVSSKLDDKELKLLQTIVDSACNIRKLVNALLRLAHSVREEARHDEITDTRLVLEATLSALSTLIKEHNVKINYKNLPVIRIDPSLLGVVFQNLIINSIKYRRESSPIISFSADKRGDFWQFSVKDNGLGVKTINHKNIFKFFHRGDEKVKQAGLGIGLAQCQEIVRSYGGEIWVDSEYGVGSTFHFTVLSESLRDSL